MRRKKSCQCCCQEIGVNANVLSYLWSSAGDVFHLKLDLKDGLKLKMYKYIQRGEKKIELSDFQNKITPKVKVI